MLGFSNHTVKYVNILRSDVKILEERMGNFKKLFSIFAPTLIL